MFQFKVGCGEKWLSGIEQTGSIFLGRCVQCVIPEPPAPATGSYEPITAVGKISVLLNYLCLNVNMAMSVTQIRSFPSPPLSYVCDFASGISTACGLCLQRSLL